MSEWKQCSIEQCLRHAINGAPWLSVPGGPLSLLRQQPSPKPNTKLPSLVTRHTASKEPIQFVPQLQVITSESQRAMSRRLNSTSELPDPIATNRHAPKPKTHVRLPFFEKCKRSLHSSHSGIYSRVGRGSEGAKLHAGLLTVQGADFHACHIYGRLR